MKKSFLALTTATAVAFSSLAVPTAGAQFTPDAARVAQVESLAEKFAAVGLDAKFVAGIKAEFADDYFDSDREWNEDIRKAEAVLERLADETFRAQYIEASKAAGAYERDGDLDDDFIDPVDVNLLVAKLTKQLPNNDKNPGIPTPPSPVATTPAEREAALAEVVASFKELGLAAGYVEALERELREDINDRDNDFEKDVAKAKAFAAELKADAAKLEYFKPIAAKVDGKATDLDDDMYDVREFNYVYTNKVSTDRAYRALQDDDSAFDRLGNRIENSSSNSAASSKLDQLDDDLDRLDDRFDGVDDILEIVGIILGVLGLVGLGAGIAKYFDVF